jgi:basic membrane protein A and related proteins
MKKIIAVSMLLLLMFGGASLYAAPKYKIGIAFDVGGRGDKSFNDSAYEGLIQLAKTYKGTIKDDPSKVSFGTDIELKYLEPKAGGQDRELLLRALAEDGYNLVIGVGFMYTDSISKVAADFPKVNFACIDGFIDGLNEKSNITCLSFAEEQGSFLVGALAGLMVADKPGAKLGFIGGMDMALIHKFHGGFFAGAMYVNKNLRKDGMLLGQYIGKDGGAFNDPKTAAAIASAQFKSGAEIIYHAAGGSGTGLFETAKSVKKYAIGVDSDQGLGYSSSTKAEEKETGKYIVSSMLKRVDQSVFLTAKQLIETGKVVGGYATFDLKNNGVDFAQNDYNKALISKYVSQLNDLKKKVVSGEIVVPDTDEKIPDFAKTLK